MVTTRVLGTRSAVPTAAGMSVPTHLEVSRNQGRRGAYIICGAEGKTCIHNRKSMEMCFRQMPLMSV